MIIIDEPEGEVINYKLQLMSEELYIYRIAGNFCGIYILRF